MQGMININGRNYVERPQFFPFQITLTVGLAAVLNQRLVLPGVADFLLKGLTRQVIAANVPVTNRPFKWKLGNTDGSTWYMSAGNGGVNDRVVDSLIFGTGQFPFPLIPYIPYSASASILMEFEDLSNNVPYDIHIGFHGSYLFPA